MTGTIEHLTAAMTLFVGWHLLVSGTGLRPTLAQWLGEGRFRAVFSVVSLAAMVWACFAYADAPTIELWPQTAWARWVPTLVMPFAFILAAAGLTTPNPTTVGMERQAEETDPMPGIGKVTRHPFMWAVILWSLSHLTIKGDVASVVFMGGLALLAGAGMLSMDAKQERRLGAAWGPIAMTTSVLPFGAILTGRTKVTASEVGWWRIIGGLLAYVAFYGLHPWLFGAAPHPV